MNANISNGKPIDRDACLFVPSFWQGGGGFGGGRWAGSTRGEPGGDWGIRICEGRRMDRRREGERVDGGLVARSSVL